MKIIKPSGYLQWWDTIYLITTVIQLRGLIWSHAYKVVHQIIDSDVILHITEVVSMLSFGFALIQADIFMICSCTSKHIHYLPLHQHAYQLFALVPAGISIICPCTSRHIHYLPLYQQAYPLFGLVQADICIICPYTRTWNWTSNTKQNDAVTYNYQNTDWERCSSCRSWNGRRADSCPPHSQW